MPVGSVFENRKAAYDAGVHPTTQAGIAGPDTGVYSICMSDGYSDDEFNDDLITYRPSTPERVARGNREFGWGTPQPDVNPPKAASISTCQSEVTNSIS